MVLRPFAWINQTDTIRSLRDDFKSWVKLIAGMKLIKAIEENSYLEKTSREKLLAKKYVSNYNLRHFYFRLSPKKTFFYIGTWYEYPPSEIFRSKKIFGEKDINGKIIQMCENEGNNTKRIFIHFSTWLGKFFWRTGRSTGSTVKTVFLDENQFCFLLTAPLYVPVIGEKLVSDGVFWGTLLVKTYAIQCA